MKVFYSAVSAICLLLASNLSHSDTLLEIYQQALENDPELAAAKAALEAGRESKRIGLSAILPQIDAYASYGEEDIDSNRDEIFVLGNDVIRSRSDRESDGDTRSYTVSLQQPVFDMTAWYTYKQGGLNSQAAVVQFQVDQQDFVIRVATAYFDVLRAIDTLKTALAEQTALQSQLEQTQQRFQVGLTAITDVHEVKAQYDSAVANTLAARGNLAIFYEALEVLTGQQVQAIAPMEDKFPVTDPVPADRQAWVEFALKNNYILQTARLNAELAELTAKSRRSAHYPVLTATLSRREVNASSDGLVTSVIPPEDTSTDLETSSTNIFLDLSIPLYSGGLISAQRRQAYFEAMRAEDLVNLTRRQTIQLARSAHLAVETGVARVQALQQAIISSQSALETTQAGYDVGTRTLVDVLLAQRSVFLAQFNYYDALYTYILNTLTLKQAAGTLSAEDIVELNRWVNADNQISPADFAQ
jgi:outer membrane protein